MLCRDKYGKEAWIPAELVKRIRPAFALAGTKKKHAKKA
jgi:hypothetical protein